MKNKYIVENNYVRIFLRNRKGEINFETLIDLDDFDKVNAYGGTFFASRDPNIYVRMSIYLGKVDGKYKYYPARLSRIIMDCFDSKLDVDHRDKNTLDNRKSNLRISTRSDNLKNRQRCNLNSQSGHRNICFIGGKWQVQLQIEGKNTTLKRFNYADLDKAIIYTEEMRLKYYGEYSGNTQ